MTDRQIIVDVCPYQGECSVSGCKRNDDGCFVRQLFEERYKAENQIVELNKKVEAKEQECEELKEEIKLSKGMLIQNTSETNKYTIPQIIEQFISDNYIDQQNDDGYTIPIFIQLEEILYEKESLEEKLGFAETTKGLQRIEIDKLKQTLAEIKEICNNNDELKGDFNLVDCDKYKLGKHNLANKILQKISECEVNIELKK